ncbi:hypothetical protein [uncultured Fibrobacter sp.]|uniref:lipopolysaccharide biosynthesis protein n=1 Tax=uncultured Fibrobacter sp. TaxID=261512 RepID=UPI002806389A|nr:hypothetical protein [uncultured Fibrobacter sp.]
MGASAYGFVGLASNFVSYAAIITTALNSMAGRFITISIHQNRIEEARKYFSSVFFANIILVSIISIISILLLFHLEFILDIPNNLMNDVKMLFGFIFLNFFISIIFNVYNVSTFIVNRLDLSSTRSIISNILKALSLLGMFWLFSPSLWFVGFATVISTIYVVLTNIHFKNTLTPELIIGRRYFNRNSIRELLFAGVWLAIGRINKMLCSGFDLLLANLMVGSAQMGILSIARRLPVLTLTLYERINAVYAPPWTKLYAQGKTEELHQEILKSIRFFGLISIIPTAFIFIFGDHFYQLWLPGQDAHLLYILTIVGCMDLPLAMPLQPIYNIFVFTNKVRANVLFGLGIFSISFIVVLIAVNIFEDKTWLLMIIAGTSTLFNAIKVITFLPIYGARCAKIPVKKLYFNTFRSLAAFVILLLLLLFLKQQIEHLSWANFVFCGIATCILGAGIGYLIIYNREDRKELRGTLQKAISKIQKKL